jgi:hypothetical protein
MVHNTHLLHQQVSRPLISHNLLKQDTDHPLLGKVNDSTSKNKSNDKLPFTIQGRKPTPISTAHRL